MHEDLRVDGVTYRLQYRKCGKAKCKCATGEGHGPYWYAYDGQSAARYVGSNLPEHVMKHVELLKGRKTKLDDMASKLESNSRELYRRYSQMQDDIRAIRALQNGEHVDSRVLARLKLSQFNGHV